MPLPLCILMFYQVFSHTICNTFIHNTQSLANLIGYVLMWLQGKWREMMQSIKVKLSVIKSFIIIGLGLCDNSKYHGHINTEHKVTKHDNVLYQFDLYNDVRCSPDKGIGCAADFAGQLQEDFWRLPGVMCQLCSPLGSLPCWGGGGSHNVACILCGCWG